LVVESEPPLWCRRLPALFYALVKKDSGPGRYELVEKSLENVKKSRKAFFSAPDSIVVFDRSFFTTNKLLEANPF